MSRSGTSWAAWSGNGVLAALAVAGVVYKITRLGRRWVGCREETGGAVGLQAARDGAPVTRRTPDEPFAVRKGRRRRGKLGI